MLYSLSCPLLDMRLLPRTSPLQVVYIMLYKKSRPSRILKVSNPSATAQKVIKQDGSIPNVLSLSIIFSAKPSIIETSESCSQRMLYMSRKINLEKPEPMLCLLQLQPEYAKCRGSQDETQSGSSLQCCKCFKKIHPTKNDDITKVERFYITGPQ